MESKKINQLATELAPELSDLTIIGDPTTGISKKITLSQMASLFTGTVEEYANLASFPLVGTADTIYIALDTNIIYRWNTGTSAYVELSPNIVTSLVFNDANGFDGTISLVGSTATLTITTALTQGSIGFIGASGALTQDNSNFYWDNTNKRLGINTNAPTTAIDAFGSGIIGRLNGTSTNNAFLGFASAGSNKWSIGNVQSDHRFRIYNEATTSELVSVLQTGEFGIGIANPLTKLHIFGGASALIANLDANTSVAKSISFRSGNSSRINLEVSGTESGSNAGANFFIRRYSDAGALIDTPFTITRSTGAITLTTALTGASAIFTGLNVGNASTASASININSDSSTAAYLYFNGAGVTNNHTRITGLEGATSNLKFYTSNIVALTLDSSLSATFANIITIEGNGSTIRSGNQLRFNRADNAIYTSLNDAGSGSANGFILNNTNGEGFHFKNGSTTIMRMPSNNFVGIGTTTPYQLLDVTGNIRIGDQLDSTSRYIGKASTGGTWRNAVGFISSSTEDYIIFNTHLSGTRSGEAMRIAGDGYVVINFTSQVNAGKFSVVTSSGNVQTNWITTTSGNAGFISFGTEGTFTERGYIYYDRAAGQVKLSATSDIRLKENIINVQSTLDIINKIKVREYTWKENGVKNIGFIAQELYEIVERAVSVGEDNEDGTIKRAWGVDNATLVPYLVKAIQELNAKIDAK